MMQPCQIKEECTIEVCDIKEEPITEDCCVDGGLANEQLKDPLAISAVDIKQDLIKTEIPQNDVKQFSAESGFFLSGNEKTITLPNNSTVKVKIIDPIPTDSTGVTSPDQSCSAGKGSFETEDFVFTFTSVSDDHSNSQEFGNLVIDLPAENNSSSGSKGTDTVTAKKLKKHSSNPETYEPKRKRKPSAAKKCAETNTNNSEDEKICKHCGETFWNVVKLVTHLRKLNVCKLCFMSCNNKIELKQHLKSFHRLGDCSTIPKCDMCKLSFETTQLTRAHMKEFNCASKKCKHCGVKLETRLEYEQHMMECHASNEKCPFCNLAVKTRKIKKHYFAHTLIQLKLFLCSHCNNRFSCNTNYRAHKCPAANELECEKCHFGFINYIEHDEHVEVCRNMIVSDHKPRNRNKKSQRQVYARNIWLQ